MERLILPSAKFGRHFAQLEDLYLDLQGVFNATPCFRPGDPEGAKQRRISPTIGARAPQAEVRALQDAERVFAGEPISAAWLGGRWGGRRVPVGELEVLVEVELE